MRIQGTELFGREHVIGQVADDTTLFLKYEGIDLRHCRNSINEFKNSRLKMSNLDKTKLIDIGGDERNSNILLQK